MDGVFYRIATDRRSHCSARPPGPTTGPRMFDKGLLQVAMAEFAAYAVPQTGDRAGAFAS